MLSHYTSPSITPTVETITIEKAGLFLPFIEIHPTPPSSAAMAINDEKKRPVALKLAPVRTASTDSSSSSSSLKPPRTPRFAEATAVHSPAEPRLMPFSEKSAVPQTQVGDIGFGYINDGSNRESVAVPMTPRSPLKSAMKVPGTPGRKLDNMLSPTFREEQILDRREVATEKEQARDLVGDNPPPR